MICQKPSSGHRPFVLSDVHNARTHPKTPELSFLLASSSKAESRIPSSASDAGSKKTSLRAAQVGRPVDYKASPRPHTSGDELRKAAAETPSHRGTDTQPDAQPPRSPRAVPSRSSPAQPRCPSPSGPRAPHSLSSCFSHKKWPVFAAALVSGRPQNIRGMETFPFCSFFLWAQADTAS